MDRKEELLVSIIIPVYNVEEYLPACMESVCGQTYRNLEIILVDDGSLDQCGVLCDEYAARDERVQVIHKENGGLSDARNAGITKATGEYIIFVDSDDWLALDYVEKSIEAAIQYQADIVACDFCETEGLSDIDEKKVSKKDNIVTVLSKDEAMLAWLYRKYYGVSAWAKMYSARCMKGIGFPKGKLHEDVGTTYKMFLQAECTVYLNEKLYYYRQRKGSIVNSTFNPRRLDYLEFTRDIMGQMEREYPRFYQAAVSRHFQGCIQIAVAQGKPETWLVKEIRQYAPAVIRDRQARSLYRILAVGAMISPKLTVRLAGIVKGS